MNYWYNIHYINLLKNMNLVWEQHIMWTRMLLISISENLKDLETSQNRLLQNPKDIANIFRRFYGIANANIIEKLFTEHLVIGADLITALKNNKQDLAKTLNDKWYRNADAISEAFSRINPFYPKEQVRSMILFFIKKEEI